MCELNPLKDEGKFYAQMLKEAGPSVNMLEIPSAAHTIVFFPFLLSDTVNYSSTLLFKHLKLADFSYFIIKY